MEEVAEGDRLMGTLDNRYNTVVSAYLYSVFGDDRFSNHHVVLNSLVYNAFLKHWLAHAGLQFGDNGIPQMIRDVSDFASMAVDEFELHFPQYVRYFHGLLREVYFIMYGERDTFVEVGGGKRKHA